MHNMQDILTIFTGSGLCSNVFGDAIPCTQNTFASSSCMHVLQLRHLVCMHYSFISFYVCISAETYTHHTEHTHKLVNRQLYRN